MAWTYIKVSVEAAHAMHWYDSPDKQHIYWNFQITIFSEKYITSKYSWVVTDISFQAEKYGYIFVVL